MTSQQELIHRRNILMTKLLWICLGVDLVFDLIFDPRILIIMIPFGVIFCGFATFLVWKKIYIRQTMRLIITLLYAFFFILVSYQPALYNFIYIWFALVATSLYQMRRPILLASFYTLILTNYFFFTKRDVLFPEFTLTDAFFLSMFGGMLTFVLIGISKFSEDLRAEALEAKQQVEVLLQKEKESAREKIHFLAYHDELTGLPNRRNFQEFLDTSILRVKEEKALMALLFMDLDRFKKINDSLGHYVGDLLLNAVAERLQKEVTSAPLISRVGGDEFIVILEDTTYGEVEQVADLITKSMRRPFQVDGHELYITSSIGISLYPENATDAVNLIKSADIALYKSKDLGKNQYYFFAEDLQQEANRKLELENALWRAIRNKEFILHYQPRKDLMTGEIIGAEALLRWNHPERGLILPIEFISIAEETGLIIPIGEWVIKEACRQNKLWQEQGYKPIRISVNLSPIQFVNSDIADILAQSLMESGLDPRYMEIEITETVLMQSSHEALTILNKIKEIGVQISIDDFGTGYSSLSYLKRFPVNSLKVDRTFVRDITHNKEGAAIVSAVISLGHSLGLSVVAEGVETQEQMEFLKQQNCDQLQGYWISRPIPAEEFKQFIF